MSTLFNNINNISNINFDVLFNFISENINEVILLSEDEKIVYISPSFERIWGVSVQDIYTNKYSLMDAVHFKDRITFQKKLDEIYKKVIESFELEFRITKLDGQERIININVKKDEDKYSNKIRTLGVAQDITEKKQSEERMKYLLNHDVVTGLYNRTYFEKNINIIDKEENLPLCIIMIDVNGLKLVNETLGYYEGDRLLAKTAYIIKQACNNSDLVIKYGGDEFLLLLKNTELNFASEVSYRILDICKKTDPRLVPLNISFGYSCKCEKTQRIEEVIREAEDRLNRKKLFERNSARSYIISSLQKILSEKNFETEAHTKRLQNHAQLVGKSMNLDDSSIDELCLLATLHDIGKVSIPENILTKPGTLSNSEWEIMKSHSESGYRIANSCPDFKCVAESILTHHERWDGTGYPLRLKKDEIPLLARIISVLDAYDVMTNERIYKKPLSKNEAIYELIKNSGTQFDPTIVEEFLTTIQ